MSATEADRAKAEAVTTEWESGGKGYGDLDERIATALAAERAEARRSYLPDNPEVGKVAFRVEVWPHDPGANGEEYVSGHMRADEAATWLREIADRCAKYWGDPECPWAGQEGHAPATPEQDQREAEEAKAAAYARAKAEGE